VALAICSTTPDGDRKCGNINVLLVLLLLLLLLLLHRSTKHMVDSSHRQIRGIRASTHNETVDSPLCSRPRESNVEIIWLSLAYRKRSRN
jgi:hypothetical protein